jgi:hypothetical protein
MKFNKYSQLENRKNDKKYLRNEKATSNYKMGGFCFVLI